MSKKEKLLQRLLSKPRDFTWSELLRLLKALGYEPIGHGKTGGSRRAFIHSTSRNILRFHEPHPNPCLKMYQLEQLIETLRKEKLIEQ